MFETLGIVQLACKHANFSVFFLKRTSIVVLSYLVWVLGLVVLGEKTGHAPRLRGA